MFSVVIGRFQPFHNGHLDLLGMACNKSERAIVILGSAYEPPSARNPFTWDERKDMVTGSMLKKHNIKMTFAPISDQVSSDTGWAEEIRCVVRNGERMNETNLNEIRERAAL